MTTQEIKPVLEAILMAAEQPLSIDRLQKLLESSDAKPNKEALRESLDALREDYQDRGVELAELASGFRFRSRAEYAEQVGRLFEERKPRYSRAYLETLAIIAYRQPITRGEIEHIRGVAVSTNIMRQLLEREWVSVVGHRDVPGRPSVYATTRQFLDYFGLKSLDELPSLAELRDIDDINADLFDEVPAEAAEADARPSLTVVDGEASADADSEGAETAADADAADGVEPAGDEAPAEAADSGDDAPVTAPAEDDTASLAEENAPAAADTDGDTPAAAG
ncbi:MAG: SMC-Scp complex subunit ScpB [Gammaproteobacteria bacterium]